jgi:HEAT repeat protein
MMALEKLLTELGDENKNLLASHLVYLSDLPSEEVEAFARAWEKTAAPRRHQLVNHLVSLAEDNSELNFDSIFRVILGDPEAEVRNKAVEGLAECEDPKLIEPLLELAQRDMSEEVRAAAISALGHFALLAELQKIRPKYGLRIMEALIALIREQDQPLVVRRRGVEAVAPLSQPEVKKAITEAYLSPLLPLKVSALYAMGRNCDSHWLSILLTELRSAVAEIRYEAAGALGELGDEAAVPHLIPACYDEDVQVREASVRALGKLGGTDARLALQQCLQRADPRLRQAIQEALVELESLEDPFEG